MIGRIITGDEVGADVALECDVCVVGSGPGGSWLAHELVAQGKSVVMLEEGSYRTRADFDLTEEPALASYQEQAGRTTEDRSIVVLQGRGVGGGTVINWTSSFRTPDRILKNWADVRRGRRLRWAPKG